MLALALALFLDAGAPTADPFARFAGKLAGAQCRVTRSTGDKALDRVGCAAIEMCEPPYQSRVAGAEDRWVPAGTRRVMRAALVAKRDECLMVERQRLLATRGAGQ